MRQIQILLAEDDELFRLGLRTKLNQVGFTVVAEAEDGEGAVEQVQQQTIGQTIDIVLLDVGLPGIGGLEACRRIKQAQPELPVLILTSRSQKDLIVRLIEAGAQGYCLKGIPAETLILAIQSVAAGASWWDRTATSEIRAAFENPTEPAPPESPGSTLTKRELEILTLMAQGKTNAEIADLLYITPGTVRVHVHGILQKLDVRDRTQAVILAFQQNLIPAT